MNLKILSASVAQTPECQDLVRSPQFRKATKNMAFAMAAIEKALAPLNDLFMSEREHFGMVFTSQTGELETTLDFLKTLEEQKLARPLLFQNSLHNSTPGFVAIQKGLVGPVISISPGCFDEEQAIEAAHSLLEEKICRYCIVLSVNVYPQFQQGLLPPSELVDGASCLILSTNEFSPTKICGTLNRLDYSLTLSDNTGPAAWIPVPHEQQILCALAQDIHGPQHGHVKTQNKKFGHSEIHWSPRQ